MEKGYMEKRMEKLLKEEMEKLQSEVKEAVAKKKAVIPNLNDQLFY